MNWEPLARVAFEAIDVIDEVVATFKDRKQDEGMKSAADALTIIGAVVASVRSGDFKNADPERIAEDLERLKRALRDNDKTADDELADKFKDKEI